MDGEVGGGGEDDDAEEEAKKEAKEEAKEEAEKEAEKEAGEGEQLLVDDGANERRMISVLKNLFGLWEDLRIFALQSTPCLKTAKQALKLLKEAKQAPKIHI